MKISLKILLLVIGLFNFRNVAADDLLSQLEKDLSDENLDQFSRIEAAFIVSGARTQVEMETAKDWYQSILNDISTKNLVILMHQELSAERLFLYFHTTWLKQYKKEATSLLDIQYRKEFNCVSATVLYNLTCDELGLETQGFETPTHVYTIFTNFDQTVMVENTTSMGFNILKNLNRYSQFLSQYYPEKMVYQIGLDRLYAYENSKGRQINNTEIIGLICYNQAFFAAEKEDFPTAYHYVLLAQKFNRDSRSNRNFEMNLYYRWGQQLVKQLNFSQAFTVYADGVSRYPEHKDFQQNCLISFKNAMTQAWQQKNWPTAENCVQRMSELALLDDSDFQIQKNMLFGWVKFFIQRKEKLNAQRVLDLFKTQYPEDLELKEVEEMIRLLPE